MSQWLREVRVRLEAAGLEPAREAEIAHELAQHVSDRYDEMLASGASEEDARRAALAELADDTRMRQELARVERPGSTLPPAGQPTRAPMLAGLWGDLRYAVRMLAAARGFTALAVLTLALGIGATAIVYTIVDTVLLRTVPYEHAERLVRIFEVRESDPARSISASYPNFASWQADARSFDAMGIYRSGSLVLTEPDPRIVNAGRATPGFFEASGARAALGRLFSEEESSPGGPPVVVLSHGAWQRRYGADPDIVGRTVTTADGALEIIGVLEPARMFGGTLDFWLPLRISSDVRAARQFWVLGRLRDGVSLAEAQSEMASIASTLADEHPESNRGWSVRLTPIHEWTVQAMREPLHTFLAGAGCLLLMACTNVAGLLIARGVARTREVAVRTALGASRRRIVRQLLTESVVLGLAGGAAGALVAWWAVPLVVPLFPVNLPEERIALDVRVLLVVLTASGLTGVLFGILPALGIAGNAPATALKDSAASTSRWRRRVGNGLLVGEMAIAFVLLVAAGLMIRSLVTVRAVPPGIDPERVLALNMVPLVPPDAPMERRLAFYRDAVERIAALPGVEAAAAVTTAPFSGSTSHRMAAGVGGVDRAQVSPRSVSPRYFETMGIPMMGGRDFGHADTEGAARVIVVNEMAARQLWPGIPPIGQHLRFFTGRDTLGPPHEVVGVVGDVRHEALDEEVLAEIYHPVAQAPEPQLTVVARTAAPAALATSLRSLADDFIEPALLARPTTFAEMVDRTTRDRRNRAILLAVVGALGMALATVGVFSMVAFSVGQRTREIGVRMALGADAHRVLRTIVGSVLRPLALGVVVGIGGAWATTRVLTAFLWGVEPTDPVTFAAVVVVLVATGVLASYLPARRVLRVDPVAALRAE